MENFQEAHQPNNDPSSSEISSPKRPWYIQDDQDFFCFLKNEENPPRPPSFFSESGLGQDIIKVTDAEPDIALEAFYALYQTLWPQIERQSDTVLQDAWASFLGGATSKGVLCPPEMLMDDHQEIKANFKKDNGESQVFLRLDAVVRLIENLKMKLADSSGEIFQREEILESVELVQKFYEGFRSKVKDFATMSHENQDATTNYHALENLLEPKAVMMGDIFAHHWAYRISRKKAQKLLSLDKWKNPTNIPSNEKSVHRTVALPEKDEASEPLVYFKANGSTALQPEKEFMLESLYRQLEIPVPETTLLVLTNVFADDPNYYYAVQALEAVPGESALQAWQKQENRFEEKSYVKQVVGALLTNPSNGKFQNFKYCPKYQTLISINNNSIFKPEFMEEDNEKIVNVKSILFGSPQIEHPIPESIKTFFSSLDPHVIILKWLQDLSQKNKQYKLLFTRLAFQKTRHIYQSLRLQDKTPLLAACLQEKVHVDPEFHGDSFYPQILISKSFVSEIKEKLQIITRKLSDKTSVTVQVLFEEVSPFLGKYYRKLRFEFPNLKEASEALWGKEKDGVNYSKLKSLIEDFESLSLRPHLLDGGFIPDMIFNEYKNELMSGESPLDKFIKKHNQRIKKNLLNLREVLEDLELLTQERLTTSQSPQDIVDFHNLISKMAENDQNLMREITVLLTNLPNAEVKWLFTLEKYFKKSNLDIPEGLRSFSISVTGELMKDRTFVLSESEKEWIFDKEGDIKKNTSLTGRLNVNYFPQDKPEFYLKQYPELPGYEFASLLFMRMIGITRLPYQELIVNKNSEYPILLTQAVDGEPVFKIWQNPEAFNNLDPFHTGLLIIAAILINPEDGKEDNFLLSRDGKYLIPIDNDHYFLPSTFQQEGSFWNAWTVNTALQTKTLLFCLDEMKKPLDYKVRKHILALNFDELLKSWIRELGKADDRYSSLADKKQQEAFLKKDTALRISFYPDFIHHLSWKLNKIKEILRSNSGPTPLSLLKAVEPFAANCYQDSFQHGNTLQSRFKAATDRIYIDSKTGSRMSILSTKNILNIINKSEKDLKDDKMGLPQTLKVLEKLIQERDSKRKIEQDLLCKLDHPNEESLWTTLFGNPILENALKDFFKNPKEGLALKGSKLITSSYLTYYFGQSTDKGTKIKFLSLPNSPLLDGQTIKTLVDGCPNIEYLDVSGCMKLEEIVTAEGEFPVLTRLEAKDCLKLKKLISASPIRVLRIGTHQKIEILVEKSILDSFVISTQTNQFDFSLQKGENFEIKPLEKGASFDHFLQYALLDERVFNESFESPKITIGSHLISCQKDLGVFITSIDLKDSEPHLEQIQKIVQSDAINLKSLQLPKLQTEGTSLFQNLIQGNWPKLTHLDLSENEITDEGLAVLSQEKWPQLEILNLSSNKITKKGFLDFVLHTKWLNLKEIPDFPNNLLPRNWDLLKELDLSSIEITKTEISSIVNQSNWPNLVSLNLSKNNIGDEGFKMLAHGNWPQLENLNMTQTNITNKGLLNFYANGVPWPNLKEINLPSCIDSNLASFLLQKKSSQVERLELKNHEITSEEIVAITNKHQFKQLKYLNISDNEILDQRLAALAIGEWPLLEELHIRNIKITQKGIDTLSKMNLPNLKKLDISENAILDRGLNTLISGNWPLLQHLVYEKTQVTLKGNIAFLENFQWPNLRLLEHSLTESFYNYNEKSDEWSLPSIVLATAPIYYKTESILVTVLDTAWLNSKEIYLTVSHNGLNETMMLLPRDKLNQLEHIKLSLPPSLIQPRLWPSNIKTLDLSNMTSVSEESVLSKDWPLLEELNLNKAGITTEDIGVLVDRINWPSLKKLDISHNQIFDEGLQLLLSEEWSLLLESLNLRDTLMTAEGLKSLRNSPNLKSLDISDNVIEDQALEKLSSKWPGLENIILSKTSMTAEGLKTLVTTSKWTNLKILDVSDNNSIGDKGLQFLSGAFTHLENLPSLEGLNLRNIGVTAEGMNSLLSISKIKILDISCNNLSNKVENLHPGKWTSMENLNLSKTLIKEGEIKNFISISGWVNLKVLDVSDNLIEDIGLKSLASGKWPELEVLNLRNISITAKGITDLVSTSRWPQLKLLDVSHNPIQNNGLEWLFPGNWPLLENLNLKKTGITEVGIESMIKISNWPNLKLLDVSDNSINDKGLESLSFGKWPLLKNLNLIKTSLTIRGIEKIVRTFEWPNLKKISLGDPEISSESVQVKKLISSKWPNIQLTQEEYNN